MTINLQLAEISVIRCQYESSKPTFKEITWLYAYRNNFAVCARDASVARDNRDNRMCNQILDMFVKNTSITEINSAEKTEKTEKTLKRNCCYPK